MLPTEVVNYLALFFAFSAFFVAVLAFSVARQARRMADVRFRRSAALRQLAAIQTELTELADSIASYGASLKKLRARVGMREARAAKANGSQPPADPAAYKAHLREQLRKEGRL